MIGHRRLMQFLSRRRTRLKGVGPVVSFTFDDFPRTAYTLGGTVLKDHGVRGTFYTSLGLMYSANGSGEQFHLDDLFSLVADGHELATHTFHHVNSRAVSLPHFLEEVREGREAMRRINGLVVSNNFAYPFGAVTAAAKGAVGSEMLSCRGIFEGINEQVVDLNLLRANALYGDVERFDLVDRLILENERRKGWLIFYTHEVQKAHSPYGCTPRLLEYAVDCALKKSMNVLTVDEVLTAIGANQKQL